MKNTIYMAPMEGLTDFTFRNAYEKIFGKGKIVSYFPVNTPITALIFSIANV